MTLYTEVTRARSLQSPAGHKDLVLSSYDSGTFGPLFAVSDEGSAAEEVVRAAYRSAKARALWPTEPLSLGVALDGERMTSAGEVPIGPEEYEVLNEVASGKVPLTTNVGVRMNTRLTHQLPEFAVGEFSADPKLWVEKVVAVFAKFLHTIDGRPRPLTVRLSINSDLKDSASLEGAISALEAARQEGRLGPANLHRFSLLIVFNDEIARDEQLLAIESAIDLAERAGIFEVALDGKLKQAARLRQSVQSLLNILDTKQLQRLLLVANAKRVQLRYRHQLDVDSAARTIWTGLHTARVNGFSAGKFGLLPMTLEEQAQAVEAILRWSRGWTAIPAFYVDSPLVTANEVFDDSRCEEAAKLWLRMARGAGATLVLFDCPDRVNPRRLLKTGQANDVGVLTIEAVERIKDYGDTLGVSILWSGGITSQQAFDLANRKVFGIFSTSSTAIKVGVTAQFERDPYLAAESEPTEFGIRRMHAIIQAGFLSAALPGRNEKIAKSIVASSTRLLEVEQDGAKTATEFENLDGLLIDGWKAWSSINGESVANPPLARRAIEPAPANAVRVFRGRKRKEISHSDFTNKLGSVFMPITVQMQRLYGLNAYLPMVPPETDNKQTPDELALVFYSTQGCYKEAKRCVGGRAYSDMHELVFDMKESKSGFPELFSGKVEFDKPYYIYETSVDWQSGSTRMSLGERLTGVTAEDFRKAIESLATKVKSIPGGLDGVIFCLEPDWVAWWEHSRDDIKHDVGLSKVAKLIYSNTPRTVRTQTSLTTPFAGISVNTKGDFINFQFSRK